MNIPLPFTIVCGHALRASTPSPEQIYLATMAHRHLLTYPQDFPVCLAYHPLSLVLQQCSYIGQEGDDSQVTH